MAFEHGLNAAIRRLREALGDSADTPRYIETLPRRGYRFIGAVDVEPGLVTPASPEPDATPALSSRSRPGVQQLAIGISIVLVLGMGFFVARRNAGSAAVDPSTTLRSVPVTSLPGLEIEPSLSPDGTRVAFASNAEAADNFDVYVKLLDVDGQPVRLTTDAADDRLPAWSPDGTQIAFVRGRGVGSIRVAGLGAVVGTGAAGTGASARHRRDWEWSLMDAGQ